MASGKIPGPYLSDIVPTDGGTSGPIEHIESFTNMGIGARKSAMPSVAPAGPGDIEHVGGTAGASGKHRGTNPGR